MLRLKIVRQNMTRRKRIYLVGLFVIVSALTTIQFLKGHYEARRNRLKILDDYLESVGANLTQTSIQRLPNAIIIGAEKCGTGALTRFLAQHPLIKAPINLERFFFNNEHYQDSMEKYIKSLPAAKDYEIVIEKTPAYLKALGTSERIHRTIPDAKIILLLCDPVNRTYSDFLQHKNIGDINEAANFDTFVGREIEKLYENFEKYATFHEKVFENYVLSGEANFQLSHIVSSGMYYYYVKYWLKTWKLNENFLILNGETFLRTPWKTLDKVQQFLGIPKIINENDFKQQSTGFYCIHQLYNKEFLCFSKNNKGRSRLQNHEWAPEILRKFFAKSNEKLYSLIGETFDWQ
uniref:heparan sulfate glucosamine 3-O-sulfotransferase 5-like n=1 Tax=Styela clava TaxID=7725 RepID=UPI001939DEFC|nr:heparan sulfate glucosamine 3-O-sulfotransferase 5-like [Styela clava]